MADRLKVGIVDFLNSRPLAWGFLRGDHRDACEAVYLSPARVADGLAAGELDAGLVPSIEVLRIPGLEIVPGVCVAATHEVRSVLLLSRVPLARVERVAADENSRTSRALVEILLADVYGVDAELVSSPPRPEGVPEGFDAALVIGDPALAVRRGSFHVIDLAGAWRSWTGLPFVFAVWAVRAGVDRSRLEERLRSSLAAGLASIDEMVAQEAGKHGLGADEIRRYLTENLRYELGPEEIRGLREFYRRAGERGLVDLPLPGAAMWEDLETAALAAGLGPAGVS